MGKKKGAGSSLAAQTATQPLVLMYAVTAAVAAAAAASPIFSRLL